jgi:SHS2 domain-containing protein
MKYFKLIEHTADVRLYVEGSSYEELFLAALNGMAHIIRSHTCPSHSNITIDVHIVASDITTLLIDFLSNALTHTQTEKLLFCDAVFVKLTDTFLDARLNGHKIDRFDEDIKAVTYHETEVKKNNRGNYETIIVFDI